MMRRSLTAVAAWAILSYLLVSTSSAFLADRVRVGGGPIPAPIDHGDSAPSAGAGTATHTFSSKTSTGPQTAILVTWGGSSSDEALSAVTFNGNDATVLVEDNNPTSGLAEVGAGIAVINGGHSGDIVLGFSGTVDDSEITLISLENVQNLTTAVDTDSERVDSISSTEVDLDSLTSPGIGGIRLAVLATFDDTASVSWSNATELSDLDAGDFRHSAAYDLGDDGTAIGTTTGASTVKVIVGASLR